MAAWVLAAAGAAFTLLCLATQAQVLLLDLPVAIQHHRERRADLEPLFRVIREKVDGPVLSGRESIDLIVSTHLWYRADWEQRRCLRPAARH